MHMSVLDGAAEVPKAGGWEMFSIFGTAMPAQLRSVLRFAGLQSPSLSDKIPSDRSWKHGE